MNKLSLDQLVRIGFVLKPHGYQGSLKISLQLEEAENIETEWIMLLINNKPVPFFICQKSWNGNEWLLDLEDIDSDIKAKELQGLQVYVNKDLLPNTISSKQESIIGFQLIDDNHGSLGEITDEFESAKQYFISINYKGQEVNIPDVEEILYQINFEDKTVLSKLPEGLLEINL